MYLARIYTLSLNPRPVIPYLFLSGHLKYPEPTAIVHKCNIGGFRSVYISRKRRVMKNHYSLILERKNSMNTSYVKKATLISAALLIGFITAYVLPARAAEPNTPAVKHKRQAGRERGGDFLRELSAKLNLTDEQQAAIRPILVSEAEDIKAVRQDTELTVEQKQAKIQEIREKSREKINAVLTPEQQKKFAEMKGEAAGRVRDESHNRLTMLAEQLNLTDEQKAAIGPILAAEANDVKAVIQDKSLSKEDRQAKIASIRENSSTEINKVLTPEQQAKWTELRKERQNRPRPRPRHGG
jgi:Spy/CpxP family protein refolding chaperone